MKAKTVGWKGGAVPAVSKRKKSSEADSAGPIGREFLEGLLNLLEVMKDRQISVSVMKGICSLFLAKGGEMNLRDLASDIGVTTAALTTIADKMEKLGVAKRMDHNRDRRQVMMALTPRGKDFVAWLQSILVTNAE